MTDLLVRDPSFMLRVARIVVPGMPHHITQRGNNRHDVFFVDYDRRRYLEKEEEIGDCP